MLCHGLPVHFAYNADYESLFTMGLTELPVNNKITAFCQTNTF